MSQTKKSLPFRENVAIVVLNEDGLLLACRRSDQWKAWQLPQGGIEQGEEKDAAMRRELLEEIGTCDVDCIGMLPDPIRYEWPPHLHSRGYQGQEQWYFLVKLQKDAVLDFSTHHEPEFDNSEWLTVSNFLKRVEGFKAGAYREALDIFIDTYPGLIKA